MTESLLQSIEKFAPLSGIVAVIFLVVGFLLVRPTAYFPTAESAAEIIGHNPQRLQRGALIAGYYSVVFFLVFASALYRRLSDAQNASSFLPALALIGGIILTIGIMIPNGIFWVSSGRAIREGGIEPQSAAIYYDFAQIFLSNVISIGLALLIGATGLSSFGSKLLPLWLSWTSILFAIGLLTPLHYIFEGLGIVWIVAVSLLLL